ncbi:MAG: diaminopimelate epimerase [Myxococcales bacterium]|nr:diaminopimelate epimerase [Myxococcales bacterium]
MTLTFHKYEGLGNDFVVIDAARADALDPERARALCDRHFGIGADGVLLVVPPSSSGARARMLVLNADGSRPEMCGNGIRCVALHLARRDGAAGISYVIDTDAGPLLCEVERDGDSAHVRVGMGRGRPEPELAVAFDGRRLTFARVSMGNPHAISFEEPLDAAHADRLGPAVSAELPEGTNVELARQTGDAAFDLVVWERGVGRTLACGTGACATAVAAIRSGRARYDAPIAVDLPGGRLEITVAEGSFEVSMRGPARRVFSGETPLDAGLSRA